MIRIAILFSLMATLVSAQEPMIYRAALEAVVENGADKMAAFHRQIPQGRLDLGLMATQGKLVHLAPDQTLTISEPELVMPLRTDRDVILAGFKDHGRAPTEADQ